MKRPAKIIIALLVVIAIELAVLDLILVRGLSVEQIEVVE